MSITIERQPDHLQPNHSDGLYFVVSSDKTTEYKFRYVYWLYLNGSLIFQGKTTPNPSGLGTFDIQDIVKTYLDTNLQISPDDYVHLTNEFSRFTGTTNVGEVHILFGEEYATGTTENVVLYNGVSDVPGNPSLSSDFYKVFNGSYPYNGLSYLPSFNPQPYLLTGSPINEVQGLFLTNAPRLFDVSEDDYHTLSFFNYHLGGGYVSYPYQIRYDWYDGNGTYISSDTIDNITSNGGGPLSALTLFSYDAPVILSGSQEYNILSVATGPKNLISLKPSNTSYYTATLFGINQSAPTCSSGYTEYYIESCQFGYKIPVCFDDTISIRGSFHWGSSTWFSDCWQLSSPGGPGGDILSGYTTYTNCADCYLNEGKPANQNANVLTGSPPTFSAVSETFQFNITDDCDVSNNRQILWRNQYGVYDYFRFTRRKQEGLDIERETYKQLPVSWGSSDPKKTQISRGTTDFYGKQTETHILNSGFISTPLMNYLEGLFISTDVYLIEPDGTLFPINITSTEYIRKNRGNRTLTNISITYQYSNNAQLL